MTLQSDVPLCFDTNAVWGERAALRDLRRIRQRFPKRRLLIPAWVVAERMRQLAQQYGTEFRPEFVVGFLEDIATRLEVIPFSKATSLRAWSLATSRLPQQWDWGSTVGEPQLERPCGERCRSGDYLVYANAIEHGAILVTNDQTLALQARQDALLPGVVSMTELLEDLGNQFVSS